MGINLIFFFLYLSLFMLFFSSMEMNMIYWFMMSSLLMSFIFFYFSVDFLGLIFIMVYIGAMTIIWLIFMMLMPNKPMDNLFKIISFNSFMLLLLLFLNTLINYMIFDFYILGISQNINWYFFIVASMNNMGFLMYSKLLVGVLIMGLMLFMGLLAVVVLNKNDINLVF